MVTLRGITENLAFQFGQQFNQTLQKSIEDSVIELRALFIRQDLQRNQLSLQHYIDSFCLNMELVDKSECEGLSTGDRILRSTTEIPRSIRLKGMGRTNYRYVGPVDRSKPFVYVDPEEMMYVEHLPFTGPFTYYTIKNDRLFLLNRKKGCKVLMEGIIEDPRDIADCNYPDRHYNDIPFSCPADLIVGIKDAIKQRFFPELIKDGEEVNIEKGDTEA